MTLEGSFFSRGREIYGSAAGPMGRNSQRNKGLGKSVREREKGRGGDEMHIRVQGVKQRPENGGGRATGQKERERVYAYSVCACKKSV